VWEPLRGFASPRLCAVYACIGEQNTIQCNEYQSAQADGRPFFDNTQLMKQADADSLFGLFTKE